MSIRRQTNVKKVHLADASRRHSAASISQTGQRCLKHFEPECAHCRRVLRLYFDSIDSGEA